MKSLISIGMKWLVILFLPNKMNRKLPFFHLKEEEKVILRSKAQTANTILPSSIQQTSNIFMFAVKIRANNNNNVQQ